MLNQLELKNIFSEENHLLFCGVGGVSMSALCRLCREKGIRVSGYDAAVSPVTEALESEGIPVSYVFDKAMYEGVTAIVYTVAIHTDDPVLAYPASLGIPLISRADALGHLMLEKKRRIGVAGSHGKSTTTGMLTAIYLAAGLDPMVLAGAAIDEIGGTLKLGHGEDLIFEACEYQDSFLHFSPTVSVILDVEHEHVDYFPTPESIIKSFVKYANLPGPDGFTVIDYDTPLAQNVSKLAVIPTFSVSLEKEADYTAKNLILKGGFADFDACFRKEVLFHLTLAVPGRFQAANALCAIAAAHQSGVALDAIRAGLQSFHGVDRRFSKRGELHGVPVIDDYAHHPTEAEATLAAARACGYERITCVFQSHTYSRTQAFWEDFKRLFGACREVIFADIYPAREEPIPGITAEKLAEECTNGRYLGDFDAIAAYLKDDRESDLYLIMGAGTINHLTEILLTGDDA